MLGQQGIIYHDEWARSVVGRVEAFHRRTNAPKIAHDQGRIRWSFYQNHAQFPGGPDVMGVSALLISA
jgi:hypothetical protein